MSRPKAGPQLIGELRGQGVAGSKALVSGTGTAVWGNGALERGLTVVRAGDGTVERRLAVDDKELGQLLTKFGRFAVGVHTVRSNRFEWPSATELLEPLASEVRSGPEQVKDRNDLCRAFKSVADVSGGMGGIIGEIAVIEGQDRTELLQMISAVWVAESGTAVGDFAEKLPLMMGPDGNT